MLDLQRYAFYDAKRTMRLTLEPVSISAGRIAFLSTASCCQTGCSLRIA